MIDAEAAALFAAGSSFQMATVDASGMPRADRAFWTEVRDGGTRLGVAVVPNDELLENLRTTRSVAITATHIFSLASVQVKGKATSVEPETADECAQRHLALDAFFRNVNEYDGIPLETLNQNMRPEACVVFEIVVDEVFDQTPGPAAGRRLAPTPR